MPAAQGLVSRVLGRSARKSAESVPVLPERVRAMLATAGPDMDEPAAADVAASLAATPLEPAPINPPEIEPSRPDAAEAATAEAAVPAPPLFCSLLVDHDGLPSADDIALAVNEIHSAAAAEVVLSDDPARADQFTLRLAGHDFTILGLAEPLADEALGAGADHNADWPEARAVCDGHSAQIVIAPAFDAAAIETPARYALAVNLQLLAATVAALSNARAVYWSANATLLDPLVLIDSATAYALSGRADPTSLVQLRLVEAVDADGQPLSGLTSHGLAHFIGREFVFAPAAIDLDTLGLRAIALADYLLDKGPVIADGDSFGADDAECFRVRHELQGDGTPTPVLAIRVERSTALAA